MKKSPYSTLTFPDSVKHAAQAFFEADSNAAIVYDKLRKDRGSSPLRRAEIARSVVERANQAGRKLLNSVHNTIETSNAAIQSQFKQALPYLNITDSAAVIGLANSLKSDKQKHEFLATPIGLRALNTLGPLAVGITPGAAEAMRESYFSTKFPEQSAELADNIDLTKRATDVIREHQQEIKVYDHLIQNPDVESATDYDI